MANQHNTGLKRIINAAGYSINGLKAALQHEAAFRQELVLFIILAPLGIWLGETGVQRALLVGCLFLVLIVEIINSAIEAVVDRISSDHNELSGRAKDMGSAAVFIALVNVVVIWSIVLMDIYMS